MYLLPIYDQAYPATSPSLPPGGPTKKTGTSTKKDRGYMYIPTFKKKKKRFYTGKKSLL